MAIFRVDPERRQQRWHRHLRKQPCVFCGRNGGHPDHVPPAAVFYGEPDDLITVPSCRSGNIAAWELDDHFRMVIAAPLSGGGAGVKHEWIASAARGAVRSTEVRERLFEPLSQTSSG